VVPGASVWVAMDSVTIAGTTLWNLLINTLASFKENVEDV
jgi:hypothetical protein